MNVGTDTDLWKQRVDSGDWGSIAAELNEYGGALLPQLLTPGEAERNCVAILECVWKSCGSSERPTVAPGASILTQCSTWARCSL